MKRRAWRILTVVVVAGVALTLPRCDCTRLPEERYRCDDDELCRQVDEKFGCFDGFCQLPPNESDGGKDAGGAGADAGDGGTDGGADAGVASDSGTDAGNAGDGGEACKKIFVTTLPTNGNLGGILGGDQKCQIAAQTLGGTWMAWLSDSSTKAIDRFPVDAGPWCLVASGEVVFTGQAALAGIPRVAISRDEKGQPVMTGPMCVWTGTGSGENCSDWTWGFPVNSGNAGTLDRVARWTNAGPLPCDNPCHLYCLEQ